MHHLYLSDKTEPRISLETWILLLIPLMLPIKFGCSLAKEVRIHYVLPLFSH